MSSTGYNTTDNFTWLDYRTNNTQTTNNGNDNILPELLARFLPTILFAVPANLTIIIIILCNKNLRTQTFFLGILSISAFDLIYCVFALPINIDHYVTWGRWRHGNVICFIYTVLNNSKIYTTALMITALSAERLLTKLRSVAVVSDRMTKILSKIMVAMPWCFFLLFTVLCVLIKHDEMTRKSDLHETYCIFMAEQTFHMPYVVVAFHIPLCLLVLGPLVMIVMYKCKKSDWDRLSAGAQDNESLFMSMLSVWIVSFVYIGFCTPMAVCMTEIILCIRNRSTRCPSIEYSNNAYTVSLLPCAIMPFLWIITLEIRAILATLNDRARKLCASPDDTRTTMSFSSLRHRMTADDI
ncbi:growth hormone secretagogue receptor type 1-like [Argopecten irradians]|uniref:growth hormone secretagogue receptor type 1-like n=1 Tax=Argopecten irradians TaxID=31199 RepID=UPI00371D3FE3